VGCTTQSPIYIQSNFTCQRVVHRFHKRVSDDRVTSDTEEVEEGNSRGRVKAVKL